MTMIDRAMLHFEAYIYTYHNAITKQSFHEDIYEHVLDLIEQEFVPLYARDIADLCAYVVLETGDRFFETVIPRRVYAEVTWYERQPNVRSLRRKIRDVEARPQPDQRTDAWYRFRHGVLTASNAWKAFGTAGSVNQLIYEKCQPMKSAGADTTEPGAFRPVSTETAMHWGQKYEPVSTMLYEANYNTTVGEFGCVPHQRIPHLAASPDGINVDEKSCLYGRMLEIKNIVNRVIDGNPKTDYWIQMQLQMEVCDLDDCDFLETRFVEYDNYDEYTIDADADLPNRSVDGFLTGSMLYFDDNGTPVYCYAPIHATTEERGDWEVKMMEKHADLMWVRTIYWKLEEYSCVLVLRNKVWFAHAEGVLADLWATVEKERVTGYEHRAPKKREKKSVTPDTQQTILQAWVKDVSGNPMAKQDTTVGANTCMVMLDDIVSVDTENNNISLEIDEKSTGSVPRNNTCMVPLDDI
jgi:putative phage-type endonuclease